MARREAREVPFDPTSEQVAVAAALALPEERAFVLSSLGAHDVHAERHRVILSVLRYLDGQDLEYDGPTFCRCAAEMGFDEKDFGGEQYLEDLVSAYPDAVNLVWHVGRARAEARMRAAADGDGEELLAELRRSSADAERARGLLARLRDAVDDASGAEDAEAGGVVRGQAAIDRYAERMAARMAGRSDHLPTGLKELDERLTWAWSPGFVTVLCGRPSNGKSSFAYNIFKWWVDRCERGENHDPRPALFMPIEMGVDAAQDAVVSRASGVDSARLVKDAASLSLEQQAAVGDAMNRYVGGPWGAWWDDGRTPEAVFELLRSTAVDGPRGPRCRYGLVIWDLFDSTLPDLRPETITLYLKRAQAVAKQCGTHLLLLAQIRRGVERRGDKRPTREDVKGSGGWEEVADQMLAVHRERVYDPDAEEDALEVGILKQRVGPMGDWLAYRYDETCFTVREYLHGSRE